MINVALAAALALLPGRYASTDRRIEARVEQVSYDRLRVELVGGGIPNGAATAADCFIVVEGRKRAGLLTLAGVPFTSVNQIITLADLQQAPFDAHIRPVRGGAVVEIRGSLPCGIGSSLDARLFRRSTQPGPTLVQE